MTLAARWTGLGATLLIVVGLAACAPEPAPSPTPTGFASEEEAFAAAEATYRAYMDALNKSRVSADTEPTPESFLTGKALTDSIASNQQLADSGKHLSGTASVISVRQDAWSSSNAKITVCMDIENVRVLDDTGSDVTPSERPDRGSLQIDVVYALPTPLVATSRVGDLKC